MLAYAAAFTLPALTAIANSRVLTYLTASTLPALTALPHVLTQCHTGIGTLQVGSKKAGVGAGQGAKI